MGKYGIAFVLVVNTFNLKVGKLKFVQDYASTSAPADIGEGSDSQDADGNGLSTRATGNVNIYASNNAKI